MEAENRFGTKVSRNCYMKSLILLISLTLLALPSSMAFKIMFSMVIKMAPVEGLGQIIEQLS